MPKFLAAASLKLAQSEKTKKATAMIDIRGKKFLLQF
jgi:hypothetical protein